MNPTRRIMIGMLSAASALSVGYLFTSRQPETVASIDVAQATQPVERVVEIQPETVDVLVSAVDLETGSRLTSGAMSWEAWPKALVPSYAITREGNPNALAEYAGTMVRSSISSGEPLTTRKLVDGKAGFVAIMLTPGMRAYAVRTDQTGGMSAGGFILPDDRVDVIHTSSASPGKQGVRSTILLENIRVLAVGSALGESASEPRIVAETATLEVSPADALILAEGSRTGEISLVLRAVNDVKPVTATAERDEIQIIRAGRRGNDAN